MVKYADKIYEHFLKDCLNNKPLFKIIQFSLVKIWEISQYAKNKVLVWTSKS